MCICTASDSPELPSLDDAISNGLDWEGESGIQYSFKIKSIIHLLKNLSYSLK